MSKKPRTGDKSFQPSTAGKGDNDRTSNPEVYRLNYDQIDWGHERELKNAYSPRIPIIRWPGWPLTKFDEHTRGS